MRSKEKMDRNTWRDQTRHASFFFLFFCSVFLKRVWVYCRRMSNALKSTQKTLNLQDLNAAYQLSETQTFCVNQKAKHWYFYFHVPSTFGQRFWRARLAIVCLPLSIWYILPCCEDDSSQLWQIEHNVLQLPEWTTVGVILAGLFRSTFHYQLEETRHLGSSPLHPHHHDPHLYYLACDQFYVSPLPS